MKELNLEQWLRFPRVNVHRQVDEQPTKRSKKNDDKSAVALLKKDDWHERRPVTDQCHDRSGKPDKKSDKKLDEDLLNVDHLMTVTDMLSWCRTWPLNGSSRIRAKPKLHKKPREDCKSSWNPRGNRKSFTMTILWKSLWRSLLELLYVYTTQIGDECDCWKSSAQSKSRCICCIVAIGSKWKLVGRFYGMLHLSAKRHRFIIWW